MIESYSKNSNTESIRGQVYLLLSENPLLTAKTICTKLNLSYPKYCNYVNKLKSEWKSYYQKEQVQTVQVFIGRKVHVMFRIV